jgi:hypothetical protein
MVILINLVLYILMFFSAALFIGFACYIFKDNIDSIFDIVFASAVGIIGLMLCIFISIVLYKGFTDKVEFTLKNKDGKVIEKTIRPIEYRHDGNCFIFANDSNYYCGWEINYQYK